MSTLLASNHEIEAAFGTIGVPHVFRRFIETDASGASAISMVLSNLVTLIYSVATIVLIFMILWGAFDWLTSGGDKEKLEHAKSRLINAFVGIMLFAVAFAIIQILGTFTGFTFFAGQR
ncbi:MAG: Uncharacterized protein G01um10147_365 [Microgenomates group bacterium Gr01-1014_7]|nr:MAG: Uncharacterized protein G01um10147_365 [Microgenomates group bacterium Gr01-1014_7]